MTTRNEAILADLLAARAEEKPDLDVLTFERWSLGLEPDEVRTYAALFENAHRIARELLRRGLERGDRFALMMRNHPEFVEALAAASLTACVAVPVDPRTRGEKLAYTLRHSGSRGLLCADYCLGQVLEVREQVPSLEWILVLETGEGAEPVSVEGFDRLRDVLAEPFRAVDSRLRSPDDPLQILYTSGTTGDPKGVVFPNSRFGLFALAGHLFGYRPDDRPYTGLSLTHGNAQAVTLAPSLSMGLRAVFSRKFTKSKLWDVCRRYGCTTFSLLGGMATAIYAEPPREDDARNPVRMVVSAGMPAALWEAFERRFGVRVLEWYGTVEGGLAIKPIGEGPIGSFGKPVPGLEMKIVDEDGNECPPGVVGEIVSRPASGEPARVEYFGDAEASRRKTEGGWLRSGDMGHRDAEGWFFFDYRKGGGIRHNGEFIHPSFVEKVIAEHPSVADVFVYGVPAASGAPGEKDIVAAVVPAPGVPFDPKAIFEACRKGLEPNAVPTYLQVVDEIPKTVSEKPQERILRERFDPEAENVFTETKCR
ncbi:MAG: ATP-dependent acyl-CoA ligase [Candidatus Binatia bacterium]|nr:MAG: ATP-dependent acyl-CoA ligase [Candidatus Binatia bacterium]